MQADLRLQFDNPSGDFDEAREQCIELRDGEVRPFGIAASYGRFWVTRLDQAARLSALCVATPSVNVTPSMTIGNWFAPFRRRHVFAAA